jgi:hypothetical protein
VVCVTASASGSGPTTIIECTGDEEYERCVERIGPSYEDYLADGYAGVSVKALYDNPATAFLNVSLPFAGSVEWMTAWTYNTWGFAIQVSEDGEKWIKVGDYVLTQHPTTDEIQTWHWDGPLPEMGYVRVLEIESVTQRMTPSRKVMLVPYQWI